MPKKILFYNWIPFDDPKKRGGGVTVYQKNILDRFTKEKDIECYFLSSGTAYKGFFQAQKPYIEPTQNIYGTACKTFRVINSPVLAPSFYQVQNLDPWFQDEQLYWVIKEFLQKNGPFAAIHFNNLEGLTLKCLYLKQDFPETKFVYSLHNYFPFCPGVNLWFHDMEICEKRQFNAGYGCIHCPAYANPQQKKLNYQLETMTHISIKDIPMHQLLIKMYQRMKYRSWKKEALSINENLLGADEKCAAKNLEFRLKNVEALNKNFDVILAVSQRVREIALHYGLQSDKVYTDYIGTKFADTQKGKAIADPNTEHMRIAYMGYARNDKGFFLFMKALELIPVTVTKNIEIVMAVKTDDPGIYAWFNELRRRYAKVIHYNGYTHEKLPEILKGVHLGIVPVLWEDNLPQVAIEMAANGVPVLTSDVGGPSELSGCKDFVFPVADKIALAEKIEMFAEHRELLKGYWKEYNGLQTMSNHIDSLRHYYGV